MIIYCGIVCAALALSGRVVNHFEENANWQAHQALAAGDYPRALAIASARVKVESFDFTARRLLAQAQMKAGQTTAAIETMLGSLDIGESITKRTVYSRGYNPAADYDSLSDALSLNGQNSFASEMQRAAADAAILHSSVVTTKTAAALPGDEDFEMTPPPVFTPLDLQTFELPEEAILTSSGTIQIARRSAITGSIPAGDAVWKSLWIKVRGARPFGFGSLIRVTVNDSELIRIYANHTRPRWVRVPLDQTYSTGTMQLTARFLNDAYDPVTRADRNVEILQAGLAAGEGSNEDPVYHSGL